jgi:TerC family integral membrane protein
MEFFAAYLVEQSLSVDNLFVFILLFEFFHVPNALQQRALKWGIIGAVVMRGAMILVGVELVQRFRSVTLVFAAILLASSYKLLTESHDAEDADMGDNAVVAIARKMCNAVDYFDGDRFFTKAANGARVATPLLLCVVCIELSDFVFAVDSIPAVLAISKDPFIVYSSNIFAIAALRSLYACLAAAIAELPYLRPSVALILGFVGFKMGLEYWHIHISTPASLAVILTLLGGGVVASLATKGSRAKKH